MFEKRDESSKLGDNPHTLAKRFWQTPRSPIIGAVWVLLLFLIGTSSSRATETHSFTQSQAKEYDALTHELIAPCCWRQPIAIHGSTEALQMLEEVRQYVSEGRSEDEVKAIYVSRYGERILAVPPGVKKGWLYLIPLFLFANLVVAAIARLRALLRHRAVQTSDAPSELLEMVRRETEFE